MLKGTLEGCVLAVISKKETYGYEISKQLMQYGFGKITEGTIYPLLLRLEKNDLITATYQLSELGPKRKYYGLTAKGARALDEFLHSYCEMANAVNQLMKDLAGGMEHQQADEALTQRK